MKELQRSRNKVVRDALGEEIESLSESMGLRVPDLDAIGTVEPPQADVVADFWAALLNLDSKGIAYNHSKDPQLIGLNMPHLGELFAANGVQTVIGTEVTTALKRCTEPQFLGQKAVDSIIRKTDQVLGVQEAGTNPSPLGECPPYRRGKRAVRAIWFTTHERCSLLAIGLQRT